MNEMQLKDILDHQPLGIAELSVVQGKYIYFNERECELRNLTYETMWEISLFDLFTDKESLELKALFNKCLTGSKNALFFKYKQADKHFKMKLVKNEKGNIITFLTEITKSEQFKAERKVDKENIKRLTNAVKAANIGCWDFYPQEGRIIANKTWVTQKKYLDNKFRASNELFSEIIDGLDKWASIVHPDDLEPTIKLIAKHLNGESEVYNAKFRMKDGHGQWRWIHDIGKVCQRDENGNAVRMKGVHIDITESKNLELKIKRISETDSLTGLLNRRKFESLFNNTIKESGRDNKLICFLMLDIDFFKTYNDTYGHLAGDDVLKKISNVLQKSLFRDDDYCFRLGGEEFGLVFKVDRKESAIILSKKIMHNIAQLQIPHKHSTVSDYITVSMGLLCTEYSKTVNIDELYKKTDALLYKAKNSGKNTLSS